MFKRLKFDWRLTLQEECFLFSSLMLVTCYFLPWRNDDSSGWNLLFRESNVTIVSGLILALILIFLAPFTVQFPRARPWAGLITANYAMSAILLSGGTSWGADLAKVFTLIMLILSARPAVVKAGDFTMKRLNSRKAELFNHWGTALHGIQFSAQEFYGKVEKEVQERNWPGVELLRIHHSEAGLLSHKREYLRVIRQRQVFDICASTFGRDYFFTLREAEIRPQLTLVTVLIFLLALSILFFMCVSASGFFGIFAFGAFLVVGLFLMMSALRLGMTRLDGVLMRTPVLGPIYENYFRRSTTYFQHDARVVFLKLMDDVLKAHVDEETSAKGVKLLSCFEHQPLLDGLYKTSDRRTVKA